ncbi:PP0621 family protein [Stutzerimonas tarimensis]|uniref:PP0621 family protein n=1 Tax=Stutzerimonas tarimensis TaxID=1507735 RepID=A0ABV7T1R7_9GAMM
MGLFRLIILIALIAAGVWVWRKLTRKVPVKPDQPAPPMVRCAQCGVHVPRDQALQADSQWYCSKAHLEQHNGTGGQ